MLPKKPIGGNDLHKKGGAIIVRRVTEFAAAILADIYRLITDYMHSNLEKEISKLT